jgi:HTH-type transcriptional regulator/antitoxin MqsA
VKLQFFAIPAITPGLAQEEFNRFVASHRVARVEKELIPDGAASFWSVCVDGNRRRADRLVQGAVTMKCPVCGAAELVHDTRDRPYTYKGETTLIMAVTGEFCPACDESVLDLAESERVLGEMRAFSKQVNAAIVDPAFISSVRKKLQLDQREAAELFGGGVNAFSRYENGKTRPPLALVKLFKVLERHPELLSEIRAS